MGQMIVSLLTTWRLYCGIEPLLWMEGHFTANAHKKKKTIILFIVKRVSLYV